MLSIHVNDECQFKWERDKLQPYATRGASVHGPFTCIAVDVNDHGHNYFEGSRGTINQFGQEMMLCCKCAFYITINQRDEAEARR